MSFLLSDSQGQRKKYALQYLFDGPEVEIKIKPHGKSKSNQPYFRTSTSTRKRISELAVSSTPKAVITDLTKEKGGELEEGLPLFLMTVSKYLMLVKGAAALVVILCTALCLNASLPRDLQTRLFRM